MGSERRGRAVHGRLEVNPSGEEPTDGPKQKLALRVSVGLRVAGTGWGDYVTRMPRASKLRGLVNPWALRRSTWSRLLVPSILPLEGRPVWCQLRISSDHAMNVSTVSWYSGSSPVS